jgi:preprotein translocase subunit YajC
MIYCWLFIAQATQPAGQQTSPQGGGLFSPMFIGVILMFVVFWWVMMGGQRKERRRHAEMLKALKRNDRVQTIGGIIGTVVDVRDNDVVLKVDENSNVKMHFNRGAVKEVLAEAPLTGGST